MRKLVVLFTSSLQEIRQVRTATVCAAMAAVGVVLRSLTIYATDTVGTEFSGISVILVGYLLGSVVGGMFGEALDMSKYLAKPMGPSMPGLILVVMLKGLSYGCSLYKKPLTPWWALAVQPVAAVVCNPLLNIPCLPLVYGEAFMVPLAPRIIRNLIMWPIDAFILFNTVKVLETIGAFRILEKTRIVV